MANLIIEVWNSVYASYYLMAVVCFLITILTLLSRLSETVVIKSGIYSMGSWLFVVFMGSFWTEFYGYYMLHWLLAAVVGFVYWFLVVYLCGRFGNPYMGDGAMVLLLPVYLLPVAMVVSVVVKGMMVVAGNF